MSHTIRVDVVSAEAEIFSGEATMVVATGELGELGITPRHAPLITRLKPGKVDRDSGQRREGRHSRSPAAASSKCSRRW